MKTMKEVLEGVVRLGTSVSFLNGRCELDKATYEDLKVLVRSSMQILNPAVEAPRVLADVRIEEIDDKRRAREAQAIAASRARGDEFVTLKEWEELGGDAPKFFVHRTKASGVPPFRFSESEREALTRGKPEAEAMWRGYRQADVLAAIYLRMATWAPSQERPARVWLHGEKILAMYRGDTERSAEFHGDVWELGCREVGLRRPEEPDYRKLT